MSVQISAMRNSHCGLKRRGFRLVTAVTLSLSINQGMDWTGQSSVPKDARDTLNAECFGAISKRFSTSRRKKSQKSDTVPVAAQDKTRTRRNWVKKRQVKPAISRPLNLAEGATTSNKTGIRIADETALAQPADETEVNHSVLPPRDKKNKSDRDQVKQEMSSTPNPAEGAGTFNKTAILKELDKMVEASFAKEGKEKEIELTKLRNFVMDNKDFFEFEMDDEARDYVVSRILCLGCDLQDTAAFMTSLSSSLHWLPLMITKCLRILNHGDDVTRSDKNLKAAIEIFKCNLDLGDGTVDDPVDSMCIELTSWANTKEQKQKDLVDEIVNLAVTKTLPIYQKKDSRGKRRRILVTVEERLEEIRNEAAIMTPLMDSLFLSYL